MRRRGSPCHTWLRTLRLIGSRTTVGLSRDAGRVEIRFESRTLEALRGNGYAPAKTCPWWWWWWWQWIGDV